jgi:alpha-1,2-mannosyltransferase
MIDPRRVATGLLIAVAVALALWMFAREDRRQVSTDFASSYFAARAVSVGANPYDLDLLKDLARVDQYRGELFPYLYPPFVCAVLMRPLAALPYATAAGVWFGCNAVFVLAGMCVLYVVGVRASPPEPPARWRRSLAAAGACAALVLLYYPVAENFRWGQINPLIFLGLMLFVFFLARRRDVAAGCSLAVIILIKIAPILLLLYLLLIKRYRAAVATLACVAALLLASMTIAGADPTTYYVERVLPRLTFGQPVPDLPDQIAGYPGNYSLNGFFSSLFVESMLGDRLPWRDHGLGLVLYSGICIALLVDLARRVRRAPPEDGSLRQLLQIGNVIVIYSLVSSITSEHHLVSLAVPLVAVLLFELDARPGPAWIAGFALASVVLAMNAEAWYFMPLFRFYGEHAQLFDGHPLSQYAFLLVLPIKLYAMVLVWLFTRKAAEVMASGPRRQPRRKLAHH